MEISFREVRACGPDELRDLAALEARIFAEPHARDDLAAELSLHREVHGLIAYAGDRPVGFKVGYARSRRSFYSWIGGVDPDFRGRGIARELLARQHAWAKAAGFGKVITQSDHRFPEMMALNLRAGFRIVGVLQRRNREPAVVFEKDL